MKKVGSIWRFVYGLDFTREGVFDITQGSGTKYTFPFAIGWMKEPQRMVPRGFVPFRAFICFIGPFAIALGFITKKSAK